MMSGETGRETLLKNPGMLQITPASQVYSQTGEWGTGDVIPSFVPPNPAWYISSFPVLASLSVVLVEVLINKIKVP